MHYNKKRNKTQDEGYLKKKIYLQLFNSSKIHPKNRIPIIVSIADVILEQVKIPDEVFSTQGNFRIGYRYNYRDSSVVSLMN